MGAGTSTPSLPQENNTASSLGPNHDRISQDLFPKKQIYGLRVLHEPPKALVDIVFIHGLTGNSYDTWLEMKSGIYWPTQLLSKDVPDARIMTFGYDADAMKFLGPVGQNNIRDHALNLLGDLAARRAKDESDDRKIGFVVHSLGGLVTKKALCLSEQAVEPHLKQLDRCTIAVAFLGTPHRGSGLTPFANGVANILKAGRIRVNTTILQLLDRESEALADVEGSFGIWLRKNSSRFDVTCFFEELELPTIGMVVTKESATINGYPQLSIRANHMDMTKFSLLDDAGYTRILGEVERWLRPLTRQTDCLKSLSFPEMNNRRYDMERAADGTCEWLLRHGIFVKWISLGRGLLWIKGKPGAGKSTLLKYALQAVQEKEPLSRKLHTTSFFFHGRGAEIQKTPLGLFRSLLHQLLVRFPRALSRLVETFKSRCQSMGKPEDKKWDWHAEELQDVIEVFLPVILGESAIRIFVDALDECGEEVAGQLVRMFKRLDSKCSSTRYGLSICFSCRYYPVITVDNCLEICVENENEKDIRRYIGEELQKAAIDLEELKDLQERIEVRAEGVFQWVSLVVPQIRQHYSEGKTIYQIREFLRQIPPELDNLYEAIIQSLKEKDPLQTVKLLQWICFARRPLLIPELRCAMNVDANPSYSSFQEWQKSTKYIDTDERMEKQLRSLSGGLAEIKHHQNNGAAQLIHQSVNDYLITKGFHSLDSSLNTTDIAVGCSQVRLSRSCIVYFSMEEIRSLPRDKISFIEYPFLEYATTSWLPHTQIAEEKGIHQGDLLDYLQGPSAQIIQHWVALYQIIDQYSHDSPSTGTTILHAASGYNLTSVVSAILNCGKSSVDADSKDEYGCTPLSWAAGRGHEAVVKLLADRSDVDADSKDEYGRTPLSWAAEGGHEAVVKLLVDRSDVDANSKDKYGRTPLLQAARGGHEAVVKLLKLHGAQS